MRDGLTLAAIRELVACGLTSEQILRVAEAQGEAGPSKGAERQRRYRERKAEAHSVTNDVTCDVTRDASPPPETRVSPTPPSETQPLPPSPPMGAHGSKTSPLAKPSGFAAFWERYPRKVGKRKAEMAWGTALGRAGSDPCETVLAGLESAVRSADWRRDPQFIPHPATWLNRDGWLDELDGPVPKPKEAARPPSLGEMEHRAAHYRDTGEWKPSWGPPPEVGADVLPFPRAVTA